MCPIGRRLPTPSVDDSAHIDVKSGEALLVFLEQRSGLLLDALIHALADYDEQEIDR